MVLRVRLQFRSRSRERVVEDGRVFGPHRSAHARLRLPSVSSRDNVNQHPRYNVGSLLSWVLACL